MKQTLITARIDVGYGRYLVLHGNWPGSGPWKNQLHMTCKGSNHWEAVVASDHPFEFKALLNGCVWEEGANHATPPGVSVEITPSFDYSKLPTPKSFRPHSQPSPVQSHNSVDSDLLLLAAVLLLSDP